jgi:hypothetical protein
MSLPVKHRGHCHCGAVQFEVTSPSDINALRCNCSICSMTGFLHLIVEGQDFALLKGEDALSTYRFNTQTAKHHFCKHCGVKSFYVPRSHPGGYSVNVNCLEPDTITSLNIGDFDGANWEDAIDSIT